MKSAQELFKDKLSAICTTYQANTFKHGHFFRALVRKKPDHFNVCDTVKATLHTIRDNELPAFSIAFQDYLNENKSVNLAKDVNRCIAEFGVNPALYKNTPDYSKFLNLLRGKAAMEKAAEAPVDMVGTVLLVGDAGVGKTALLARFMDPNLKFSEDYTSTVGLDLQIKKVTFPDGDSVKMKITDAGGLDRFKSLVDDQYAKCQAVIICFDMTTPASFAQVPAYLQKIRDRAQPYTVITLVGTKMDMKPIIDVEEVKNFARENEINACFFVSAKVDNEGDNYVNNLFESVAADMIKVQKAVNKVAAASAPMLSRDL